MSVVLKLYKLVRDWVGSSGNNWCLGSERRQLTKNFILVGRAANMALVHMQRGDADGIAVIPFFIEFCGNISVQYKDDWTHSLSSFLLSFLLIDPLALLNAKRRRDFCVTSVRT